MRKKQISKAIVSIKDNPRKKSKPWKKERGTFDNISKGDLISCFKNRPTTYKGY